MTSILVVDNYDSFVFTIVGYLEQLGAQCEVVRDEGAGYDGVLISPGPGTPEEAGVSMDMIAACADRAQPMLGVCLGHQALGVVMGATVGRAPELLHGKTSQVQHDESGVLAGLPDPFTATRYHSLSIDPPTLPDTLVVNGSTASGVQFHPESVLTQGGHRLLTNWLTLCGASDALERSVGLSPLLHDAAGVAAMVSG